MNWIVAVTLVLILVLLVSSPSLEFYGFDQQGPRGKTSTTQPAPKPFSQKKITYKFSRGTPDKKRRPALGDPGG